MGTKFKHLPPLTDEEEAEIQREIATDPDAPEATDEQLAHAMTFAEALPELAEALQKRLAGRPKLDKPKKAVNIRLDQDIIEKFKSTGPGWQSRINEALKAAKV
jgi:uncharacterized protein (DUF4415 family)